MALLELHFADHAALKKQGRNFVCAGCPEQVQKIRRCREDRWDFTAEDANIFPIKIHEGGGLYGFCPGKATWDHEATFLFEVMTVACEQKALLNSGGIADQPTWFIQQLSWFGPDYDRQKFISKARMVLGTDEGKGMQRKASGTKAKSGGQVRKPAGKRR